MPLSLFKYTLTDASSMLAIRDWSKSSTLRGEKKKSREDEAQPSGFSTANFLEPTFLAMGRSPKKSRPATAGDLQQQEPTESDVSDASPVYLQPEPPN
jgi:hypothetical protein